MKTSLVFLLVALSASALAASTLPATYRVNAVECFGAAQIQPGDTAITVLRRLSVPHTKLSRDTWVYRSIHPGWAEAQADGCDVLVVTFNHGRVTRLELANVTAIKVLAARLASPVATGPMVAAK
jgi:hypothetical protein